jgi:hypothetical protein
MSRRRRWVALGGALGVLAVATGIYFAWGARRESEYTRRVQELRDQGEYFDEPTPRSAQIPTGENAAVVFGEADRVLAKLKRVDARLDDVLLKFELHGWGSDFLTDEDYETLREVWPKLRHYFSLVESVRPEAVIAPPARERGQEPWWVWCGIDDVLDLVRLRAQVEPETARDAVSFLLDLADRWQPGGPTEIWVSFTIRCTGLRILQEGMRENTIDLASCRTRWDRQLSEVDVITGLRARLRDSRMGLVRYYESLRRGEDPYAEVREAYEEADVPLVLPERPWYAAWYGRPVLHTVALEELGAADRAVAHATDERALRDALEEASGEPGSLWDGAYPQYVWALEQMAVLRLARIAMVAHGVSGREHGPATPSDCADAWGGPLPPDPFTGEPFRFERHDDRLVLSSAVGPEPWEWDLSKAVWEPRSGVRAALFFEELLVWEVRRARDER